MTCLFWHFTFYPSLDHINVNKSTKVNSWRCSTLFSTTKYRILHYCPKMNLVFWGFFFFFWCLEIQEMKGNLYWLKIKEEIMCRCVFSYNYEAQFNLYQFTYSLKNHLNDIRGTSFIYKNKSGRTREQSNKLA